MGKTFALTNVLIVKSLLIAETMSYPFCQFLEFNLNMIKSEELSSEVKEICEQVKARKTK